MHARFERYGLFPFLKCVLYHRLIKPQRGVEPRIKYGDDDIGVYPAALLKHEFTDPVAREGDVDSLNVAVGICKVNVFKDTAFPFRLCPGDFRFNPGWSDSYELAGVDISDILSVEDLDRRTFRGDDSGITADAERKRSESMGIPDAVELTVVQEYEAIRPLNLVLYDIKEGIMKVVVRRVYQVGD